MKEAVHRLMYDAGLNFVIEAVEGDIGSRAHYVESGIEIVCTVGEDECSGVDKSKDKMKRGGCEGR
jgi:hypothetical protein